MTTALPRSKVKKEQTWNAESVFPSVQAFDAEVKSILESLPAIKAFQGRLAEGPGTFIQFMQALETLSQRATRVQVYASMSSAVDAADQQGAEISGKATSALAQVSAASSFLDPELLSIGKKILRQWLRGDPRMQLYEYYINDLFRKQTHVRSAEVEELFGLLRDPFSGPRTTAGLLTNADFKFKPARGSDNQKVVVTQSTYNSILGGTDRRARRSAW